MGEGMERWWRVSGQEGGVSRASGDVRMGQREQDEQGGG